MSLLQDVAWLKVKDGDPRTLALYLRHYSSRKSRWRRGRIVLHKERPGWRQVIAPGQKLLLLSPDSRACFAWRLPRYRADDQEGAECTLFRNEGEQRSSDLIRDAVRIAWKRWPGVRLWTYCTATFSRGKKRLLRWGETFWHAGWQLVRVDDMRFCWELLPL